jgi:hypothetical protein
MVSRGVESGRKVLALAGSKQANGIPGVESGRKVLALAGSEEANGIPGG